MMSDQRAFPPPDAPGPPAQGWGAPPPGWQEPPAAKPLQPQQPTSGQPGWGPQTWGAGPGWGGQQPGPAMPPMAAKPGVVPLRPLTLGEIYDGAFQAMRRNPAAMMGSAALVLTVITLLETLVQVVLAENLALLATMDPTYVPSDSDLLAGAGSLGVFALLALVLNLVGISLLTGILVTAVSQAVLGHRPTFGDVWRAAAPRMLPLAGLVVLFVIAYAVFSILVFVPGVVLTAAVGAVGVVVLVLGLFAWIAALLYLFARLSLAAPALVLERIGVLAAIRRGWTLTRGSVWRCLGILLLAGLIVGVANTALTVPGFLVSSFYGAANSDDPLATAGFAPVQLVITGVSSIVASTIVFPFWAGVTSLLYIDLRMRREGLDVELARAARR